MRLFILIPCILFALWDKAFARIPDNEHAQQDSFKREAPGDGRFVCFTESLPVFRGNLDSFLREHLVYPDSAREAGYEGRVVLGFCVEVTGRITGLRVLRGSGHKQLDSAAVQAFRPMQDERWWVPGRDLRNRIAPAEMFLPLTFSLD